MIDPADVEEEEEIEYVDEDGNPIDPDEVIECAGRCDLKSLDELTDKQEGLEMEEEIEEEVEEEVTYVDEDGNPIDPEDIDQDEELIEYIEEVRTLLIRLEL